MVNPSMNSDAEGKHTAVHGTDIEVLEVVLGYDWIRDDMGMKIVEILLDLLDTSVSGAFVDFFEYRLCSLVNSFLGSCTNCGPAPKNLLHHDMAKSYRNVRARQ